MARDASPQDVKAAYRSKSRELHPDRNQDQDASDRMADVNKAYEVLSDPKRREQYDKFGETGQSLDKAAVDALTNIFDSVIESDVNDIVGAVRAKIDHAKGKLTENRTMARADERRLNKRRKFVRRKKKDGHNLVDAIFEKKLKRVSDALKQMDYQEALMDEMLRMLDEYESTPESAPSVADPYGAAIDGMMGRMLRSRFQK